jgi:hypothetical protein
VDGGGIIEESFIAWATEGFFTCSSLPEASCTFFKDVGNGAT